MTERPSFLGELERAVMDVAWSRPSVSVRDVVDQLQRSRGSAYTTVMTVMNRLVEKGLLRRKPAGAGYAYSASLSRRDFLERSSRQVLATFVQQFGRAAIVEFIDALDDVDPQRLASLRRKFKH